MGQNVTHTTPGPTPRVRPGRIEDVPRLKELGVVGWETTYADYVRPENRTIYLNGEFWSLSRLRQVVTDRESLVLVADDSTARVTGFLTIEPIQDNRVELTRFYVDPALRRLGIGSALFASALEYARSVAARSMLVNVFADNRIGRAFYERARFRLTSLVPTLVGDQEVGDAWYELGLRAEGNQR